MFNNGMVALIIFLFPLQLQAVFDSWRAQKAYENKEYDRVQQLLAEKNDVKARFNIADAQYRAGDLKAAAEQFKQLSLAENPQLQQQAMFNRGNALAHQKEYKKALEQYDELLKQNIDTAMRERTQHNYDIVKKLLEEDEKKKEEQKQDKNNQEQKEQNQNQDNQQQDQKDQQQKQDKQDQQDKNQQDQKQKQEQQKKQQQDKQNQNKKEQGDQEQEKQQKEKGDNAENGEPEKKEQNKKQSSAGQPQDEEEKKMHPQVRALLKQAEEADERGAKQLMKAQVTAMPQKEGQKNW